MNNKNIIQQQKKRIQLYDHDDRIMNDYEELFEVFVPAAKPEMSSPWSLIQNSYSNLNLTESDLFYFRLSLFAFIMIQFSCCLLLFLLNNWHYLVQAYKYLRSDSRKELPNQIIIKNTLSVNEFLKTKN
jgi:hypothetical protein